MEPWNGYEEKVEKIEGSVEIGVKERLKRGQGHREILLHSAALGQMASGVTRIDLSI